MGREWRRLGVRALGIFVLMGAISVARAADPQRGMLLFMNPPAPNQLACQDCHSDNPQLNNFGNIWVGRNTVALIQRAVNSNTGGMGYFNSYYNATDLADIAAWLGNSPSSLGFPLTAPGSTSAAQRITISSSTKADLTGLTIAVEGDFVIVANACAAVVPRLSGCAVDLAFRPGAEAGDEARIGALALRHDGAPTTVRLPLLGKVQLKPPAVARLAPAALDFGSTPVGLPSVQRHVRLSNGSSSELVLGAISVSSAAFVISGGSCHDGLVLGAGRSCLLSLRLVPGAAGAQRAELRVQHDGVGGQSLASLSGSAEVAPVALLTADLPGLDFGVAAPGARASGPLITISNRGNRAALLREPSTNDAGFSIERSSCTPGLNLLPTQRCQILLAWTPGREGAASAELRISADGAETLRLPLSGLAATASLHATPNRLAFDARLDHGDERSVQLVNRGSGALRLSGLVLAGPEAAEFTIGGGSCVMGQAIAAGSSCSVQLRFAPRAAGARLARLQVSADGVAAPLLVELFGQARSAAEPTVWVDAAAMRFADRSLGDTTAPESLTLKLRAAQRVAAPILRVVGDAAGDFLPVNGCTAALAAQDTCSISLRFVPTAPGLRSASLWLGSAGGHTLALVNLEGHAGTTASVLLPAAAASAGSLAWTSPAPASAAAAVGESPSAVTITLGNRGATSSAPLAWALAGRGDFSIDPNSPCVSAALAPGANCTLRLWFHPGAAGERRAWLHAASDSTLPGLELSGRGLAPARGELHANPGRVVFQARAGMPSDPQRVVITNQGAGEVDISSVELQGSGFTLARGPLDCGTALLVPGEACALELAWPGSGAAISGATLAVNTTDAFASAQVPLAVSEDPAQRSNTGTGGGVLAWPWLLALMGASLQLRRAARSQSRHA